MRKFYLLLLYCLVLSYSSLKGQTTKTQNLIFIDKALPEYANLAECIDLQSSAIVFIDPLQYQGLSAITSEIEKYSGLKSIHIISHGASARIIIGNTDLWDEDLLANQKILQNWKAHVSDGADLILYGCSIASTSEGEKFAQNFASLTGMDVAASIDLTGNSSMGGDWDLEYQTGSIETPIAFNKNIENYQYILQGLNYADLRNYTEVDEGTSGDGVWTYPDGSGRTAYQSKNTSMPVYLLSDEVSVINKVFKGTIAVDLTAGDNDDIGFAFGYQSTTNTYLWSWDKNGIPYGTIRPNGGHLLYHKTALASGFSTLPGTLLGAVNGTSQQWSHGVTYQFEILYTSDRIRIKIDGNEKFDVSASDAGVASFPAGRFGFYNYSQGNVTFGNVQTASASDEQVPPTAQNDYYGMSPNTTLNIGRLDGILTNDYDANLDEFSIILVSGVSHGSLNLNLADGSFTYTPTTNYQGLDEFSYKLVEDGTGDESTVRSVSIGIIESNEGPTDIQLSNNQISEGAPNNATIGAFTTTDANNPDDVHDYSLTDNGGGRFTVNDNQLIVANYSLLTPGDYTITVRSTDLFGLSTEKSFTITVISNSRPTSSNSTITINEDTNHSFQTSDFSFNDADGDSFGGIRIESTETAGDLEYNGSDVFAETVVSDISLLVFKTPSETSGTPYAAFTFKVLDSRGGISSDTYTFTINVSAVDDPPVLSGNDTSPTYYAKTSSPMILFPAFTITDIDGGDITGLKIYFSSGHHNDQDNLQFTNQNGITGVFDKITGMLTLSGTANPANYQAAVRSITYSNDAVGLANEVQRVMGISLSQVAYSSVTGHYYEYVSTTLNWTSAKAAAELKNLYGLQGYLATVTTQAENDFIQEKLAADGWIGGTDTYEENKWIWATGPENGTQFWQGIDTGYTLTYSNWNSDEPNNSSDEDYLQIYSSGSSQGKWNDLSSSETLGYIVEYGGMDGDPDLTPLYTNTTLNIVANRAPVANIDGPYSINTGETVSDNVLTNDTDADGDNLDVSGEPFLSHGLFNSFDLGTGAFVYQAPTDWVGTFSFTYSATDGTASDNANISITISDNIAPTVITKNINAQLNSSGSVTITADNVNDGSTDNIGITGLSLDVTSFDCEDIGDTTVTLTAVDAAGNSNSETATVTVEDNISPNVVAKDVVLYLDSDGEAILTPDMADNGSSDNCDFSLAVSATNFNCTNSIQDTSDIEIPDAVVRGFAGRTVTFSNVNINSSGENRVGVGPGETVTISLDWQSQYSSTYCPGCSQQFYFGIKDVGITCLYSGSTNYSLSGSGNLTFTAPTTPGIYPIQTLSSLQFACTAGAGSLSSDLTDAIGYIVVGNPVVLTGTDSSGNTNTATFNVSIVDNTPPTIIGKDITVELDGNGAFTLDAIDVNDGSYDNCSIENYSVSKSSYSCIDIGQNDITFTVTDAAGNSSSQIITVTVEDNAAPLLSVKDTTLYLNSGGTASINVADVVTSASDNCSVSDTTLSVSSFSCSDLFTPVSVNVELSDENDNSVIVVSTVTVLDTITPVAMCKDTTVYLDETGNVSINPTFIDNGSYDNCSFNLSLNMTDFSCENVGTNPVTLKATDASDNSRSCEATVTVLDTIAPVAICKDITLQLNSAGSVIITPDMIDGGSYDACTAISLTIDSDTLITLTCESVGENQLTLVVTDLYGNVSTCVSTVTIEDNSKPVAICKDVTVYLDKTGFIQIDGPTLDNGSYDNCKIHIPLLNKETFDCNDLGPNLITMTVTDFNQNYDFCESTVTIADSIKPEIEAMDDITVVAEPDACSKVVEFATPEASDICGVTVEQVEGPASGSEFPAGSTLVTFRATDASGNIAESSFTVSVEGINKAPVIDPVDDVSAQLYETSIEVPLTGLSYGEDCLEQSIDAILVEASNTEIVTGSTVTYIPGEDNAIINLTLAGGISGTSNITVSVKDNAGVANDGIDSTQTSFVLTVAQNQAPQVAVTADTIYVDKGATSVETLPTDLFSDPDAGDELTFEFTGENGAAIPDWISLNAETMEVTLSPTENELGEHKFVITATDKMGETASLNVVVVVEIPTGIDDLANTFGLNLYPNPTKGTVFITIDKEPAIHQAEVSVHNLIGQSVLNKVYDLSGPITLDLSNQTNGFYFVKIKIGANEVTRKIILKKE